MVRFTLDGEEFELTQELVRQRIASDSPESIQQYWVEIDDQRWPVKQVMALATGLERTRFQSQNSCRLLAKLGFTLGNGATPLTAGSVARAHPRSRGGNFDVACLRELERLHADVGLNWRLAGAVVLDSDGFPSFPLLRRGPGLYRFDFGIDVAGIRTLYFGESKSVAGRASNYRNAKTDRSTQQTSRRIHKEVVEHLVRGGTIEFAIATEVHSNSSTIDLRSTAARRFAENAAVFIAQTTADTRVLNINAYFDGRADSSSLSEETG